MNRLLLALAFAGATSSSVWAQPKPPAPPAPKPAVALPNGPAGVAADVNGDQISVADLNRMIDTIKAGDPGLQTDSATAKSSLVAIRGQMLDQLINTRLLVQEAKRLKIVTPAKDVDDEIETLKADHKFKTDTDLQKWLQADGKTLPQFRQFIADQSSIGELFTRLTADVTVSPDDIAAFYGAHTDQFAIPEMVKARHIMLAINPNASQADKDAVAKRAQDIIKQLKGKNADFATIAKTKSDDTTTRDNGGDMGQFARGEMIQVIEDACFNAKVGDVVGPVTTEFGLHIIRVDAKIPPSTVPISAVQSDPQIKAILLKQKVQARLDERIKKLRETAKIQKYAS